MTDQAPMTDEQAIERLDALVSRAFLENDADSHMRAAIQHLRDRLRASAEPVKRDREVDRGRFPDPAFNRWLDEGISDGGHTVYDALVDIADAWSGWSARPDCEQITACCGRRECGGECGNEWRGMVATPPRAPVADNPRCEEFARMAASSACPACGEGGPCAGCGAVVDSRHRVCGSLLWVREAWAAPHAYDHLPPRLIPKDARIHYSATEERGGLRWRPSIHMPRWASRILLEVTDVRVERLASISESDAIAEGIDITDDGQPSVTFANLWDSINGQRAPWQSNPWVWVVAFRLASS